MKSRTSSLQPISWEAPEFAFREKTPLWYTNIMIFYGVIVLIFFFAANYLAIIITSLLLWYFLSQANEKPRIVDYKIDMNGISIGKKIITYAEIRSFSIDAVGRMPIIVLESSHSFSLPTTVMVKKHNYEEVVSTLKRYIPLEQHFSLMRWLNTRLHY